MTLDYARVGQIRRIKGIPGWALAIGLPIAVILTIGIIFPLVRFPSRRNPVARTNAMITGLAYAARACHDDRGFFPSNAEGLRILVAPLIGNVYYDGKWPLTDAWGNPFIYGSTTVYSSVTKSRSNFVIISRGPDGILGTPDDIIYRSGMVNDVSPFQK
jgi:hypothetical protein